MTRPDFTPARADGRTPGQVIADYLSRRIAGGELAIGDVITHAELIEALELPPLPAGKLPPPTYYQAVSAASAILEKSDARTLRSVRGSGYTLAAGMGQLAISRERQKRASKQIKRASQTARTTDMSLVPPDQRPLAGAMMRGFAALDQILKVHAEKLSDHEQVLEHLMDRQVTDSATVNQTAEQVADLAARLARLERERDQAAGRPVPERTDTEPETAAAEPETEPPGGETPRGQRWDFG